MNSFPRRAQQPRNLENRTVQISNYKNVPISSSNFFNVQIMSSNLHLNEVKSMDNPESPPESYRNWSNLPLDITLMIFMKLGTLEILESVQFVCKMWHILCKEPSIWHTIHIDSLRQPNSDIIKHEKMLFNAIDRSDGGLIDLDINGFGSDDLCSFISSRSSRLKRLRLARCRNISANAMIEALEKLSSLEELELTFCPFQEEKPVAIINACPSLATFKFHKLESLISCEPCNEEALAIAGRMPELRHLQLIENNMTSVGLTAILDACPHLQSLELRACFDLNLTPSLRKRLSDNIKDLQCFPSCYGETDSDEYSDFDYFGAYDQYDYPDNEYDCLDDDDIADYYRNKY